MDATTDPFRRLVVLARIRNRERVISSSFLAVLIALLLWQTQWIALRPGLALLLAVQVAMTAIILHQNGRLSRAVAQRESGEPGETEVSHWFDEQERFTKRLATLENLGRFAGFALLAYGFWISTHIIWLAVALGLLYPTVIYFGLTRTNQKRGLKEWQKQRREQERRVQSKRAG